MSRCGGKVTSIDTGISHAYGGALSALEVTYTLTPHKDALGAKKWHEKEVVKALYVDHEVLLADDEREAVGDFE